MCLKSVTKKESKIKERGKVCYLQQCDKGSMIRVINYCSKALRKGLCDDRSRVFHASYTGGLRIRPTLFKVSKSRDH